MNKYILCGPRGGVLAGVVLLAICGLFATAAEATCGMKNSPSAGIVLAPQMILPTQSTEQIGPEERLGQQDHPGITGMWFVNFFSAGALWDQGFDVWHTDGTEILNDNGFPPSAGNVCLGIWKQTGPDSIRLKHPAWNFDVNGHLLGTAVLVETITIDKDADSYQGSFLYTVYDPLGKVLSKTTGVLRAYRIRV